VLSNKTRCIFTNKDVILQRTLESRDPHEQQQNTEKRISFINSSKKVLKTKKTFSMKNLLRMQRTFV